MVVELPESNMRFLQPAETLDDRRFPQNTESADLSATLELVRRLQREVYRLDAERDQLLAEANGLRDQLNEAARVQRELLPRAARLSGVDIRTLYQPIDRVGGDLLTTEELAAGTLAISLADVSGHGLAAGMLTPLLKRALSARSSDGAAALTLAPDEVLRRANHELLALNLQEGQFATALHARYAPSTRRLTFARAGNPHPILLRPSQSPRLLATGGALLGALEDLEFPLCDVALRAGDRVIFHTDGLEALIADSEGDPHPQALSRTAWFTRLADRTAEEIVADVAQRLERATWDASTADDVTLVVLTVAR